MADPRTFCEIPTTARCCIVGPIAVTALSVAGLLARDSLPFAWSARTWALTASTGFVIVAAWSWWFCRTRTATAVLSGLVFCWLGDYLGLMRFELVRSVSSWLISFSSPDSFAPVWFRDGLRCLAHSWR